jgi:putative two-component system response regulator
LNGSSRILIVDDLDSNRMLLEDLVASLGYQVEPARDGLEALAKLPLDIDLVLLDVMMPGLDGYEVVRRIRADSALCDIPVILVTALDSREDRLHAVEAGANDFIAKPIDRIELQLRLSSQLRLKEATDALKRSQAELEQRVTQRTEALRRALETTVEAQRLTLEAHLDTIQRLVLAAEFKDRFTAEHIRRISLYGVVLAQALHLTPGEVEVLRYAVTMHDVGKIGIPDAILVKEGALTPAERKIMQSHTVIGARLLAGSASELLQAGEVIALSHHERWDGGGYPHGLAGEGIPLWGRICALVDVFDALISDRPSRIIRRTSRLSSAGR